MSKSNDLIVLHRIAMRYYNSYRSGYLSKNEYITLMRPLDRKIARIEMCIFVGRCIEKKGYIPKRG
jgi:hypothetical protein